MKKHLLFAAFLAAAAASGAVMDGIAAKDLKPIMGKDVDAVMLEKLAIAHCDGVIQYSKDINPEVLAFVKQSGKPFLPYQEPDKYIDAYADFYKSL